VIEAAEMVASVIIFLSGIGVGRITRKRKAPKPYKEPEPICGCEHHFSYHDEEGCHGTHRLWIGSRAGDNGSDYVVRQCGCKQYTGPQPLPTVIP
jgi:hypothetical protein